MSLSLCSCSSATALERYIPTKCRFACSTSYSMFSWRAFMQPSNATSLANIRLKESSVLRFTFQPAFVHTALLLDAPALFWAHATCNRIEPTVASHKPILNQRGCPLSFVIAAACIAFGPPTGLLQKPCLYSGISPTYMTLRRTATVIASTNHRGAWMGHPRRR